jgi:hypothetical protein
MKKKSSPPESVYCNKCRGRTLHQIVGNASEAGSDNVHDYQWCTIFDLLQCCGCQDVVLRSTFNDSDDPSDDVHFYPPKTSRYPPRWRYKLPKDIRLLLEEIYRSLDSESLRLPMMGARALVDMLMVEKVSDVGSFKQKLQAFEEAGFVSSQNRDVLYAALDVGNAAAHRGHAATRSEIQAVMDIVENMLQSVYVFPDEAKKLKKSTPSRFPAKGKSP